MNASREARERRAAAFRAIKAKLPTWAPLRDDGLDDAEWAKLNPTREYRVRPYRADEDGARLDDETLAGARAHPLRDYFFTVIHLPTEACGLGVLPTVLWDFGFPGGPPVDTDAWAEHLFECCVASSEFRHNNPARGLHS